MVAALLMDSKNLKYHLTDGRVHLSSVDFWYKRDFKLEYPEQSVENDMK